MKRIAQSVAALVAIAVVISLLFPKRSHGLVATAVQVVNSLLPVNTESAKTPFQMQLYPNQAYAVPSDKRLVVETVSAVCEISGSAYPYELSPALSGIGAGNFANVFMVPVYQGFGSYVYWFTFNNQMKFYADPGTTLTYSVEVNSTGGDTVSFCPANVSGYLIAP